MDEVPAAAEGVRRPGRRPAALRVADLLAFAVVGAALGSLVLLVPASGRSLVVQAVFFGVVVAYAAVVLVEQRRQRCQREAMERGAPAPSVSADRRPLVRRVLALLYGAHLTGLCAVGAWPAAVVLGLAPAAVLVSILAWTRRSRRRELAAARAAHPGAAVVLVAPTTLALARLTEWARASRTTLPASPGGRVVLVADADGVRLLGVARTRPLPRWGWDEVDLRRGPHPAVEGAAAIVLTLLGPAPAVPARTVPAGRRRFDLPFSVRGPHPAGVGTWGATTTAVLDELLARHPGHGGVPSAGAARSAVDPSMETR